MKPASSQASRAQGARRRTIGAAAEFAGVTLFTAAMTTLRIEPAPAGAGRVFVRSDLPNSPEVRASLKALTEVSRHTALATATDAGPEARVETVEHLLAALDGLGVTDARLILDGPEVPILDGSAKPFVDRILDAGVVAPDAGSVNGEAVLETIRITEPLRVEAEGASIEALPADEADPDALIIEYHLDYGPRAHLKPQIARLRLSPDRDPEPFATEIAPARTFCLVEEAQALRAMGLFQHLTPEDMLVIDAAGPIDNDYRMSEEPARHKLLDVVGDLALIGRPVAGVIRAVRSGHHLNHAIARLIAQQG